MEINLYREDLKPEYKDIATHATKFEHFNEKAQEAIMLSGRAVFFACDRWKSYNAILKPDKEGQP